MQIAFRLFSFEVAAQKLYIYEFETCADSSQNGFCVNLLKKKKNPNYFMQWLQNEHILS